MKPGMNSDIEWGGKLYHVQTEDGGLANPAILTRLFHRGVVVSSRKTSYLYLMEREDLDTLIVQLMKDQHHAVIVDLQRGVF
jgi:hypothetical protein